MLEGKGNLFRVQSRDGLGRDLRKYEDDDSQYDARGVNARVTPKTDGDDRSDHRGEHVDQVIADENKADEPIRSLQQFARPQRAPVVLFLQVLQPVAVECHHAGL